MQKLFSLKVLTIGLAVILATGCFFGQILPASANYDDFSQVPLFKGDLGGTETMVASVFSFSGDRPTDLGVKNGNLGTCPASLNCVSSQSSDAEHQIEPLIYKSTPEEAIAQLKEIIAAIDNAELITAQDNYIYAEFTSKLMGFVDDVEFYLDREAGIIQVRSASRLGESDLGVNRQRVEAIRAKFNA